MVVTPGMGARRLGNESIGFREPTNALNGNWDVPNIRDCMNITTDAQVNVNTCPTIQNRQMYLVLETQIRAQTT